jgi:RimJ/RimL family protein N-acetyltransferase
MKVEPVVLEGKLVRLEPLAPEHAAGLWEAARDPVIWRWFPFRIGSLAETEQMIAMARAAAAQGSMLGFAQVLRATGEIAGSTSYLAIEPAHRRLEIGHTWVAPGWQRRGFNAEAKLLMLANAFEGLGAHRVEFKTHARNEKAREGLLGIGATYEGLFRKHMIMPDGEHRDSVWYSIVDDEWPDVKVRLEALVSRLVA